jgi:hypothetical protein
MQALNLRTEYRKAFPDSKNYMSEAKLTEWADAKVQWDGWVKDDGDYYLPEVWNAQYAEPCSDCWGIVPDPGISYVEEDGELCGCK